MRHSPIIPSALVIAIVAAIASPGRTLGAQGGTAAAPRGIILGDLTWVEAERVLTPDAVIVIPLGAQSKEHGPHLRLDNDFRLAEYFRARILAAAPVVMAPTVNYHFYPSFLEYPGSTHLRFETARDVIVDIVHSLAGYGPTRFYILNTGVSTARPLAAAAEILRAEGIQFAFTNILEAAGPAEERVKQQVRGTHADEIETSMMLYIAPDRVDMSKAVKDDSPQGTGGLTRVRGNDKTYSPTGVWGDATLATREKGRVVVEAMVERMLLDIEALRRPDGR
jgi:creatinine amidohydrolase